MKKKTLKGHAYNIHSSSLQSSNSTHWLFCNNINENVLKPYYQLVIQSTTRNSRN